MTDPVNQTPPPGFYEDSSGARRWWNGSEWGEQRVESPPDDIGIGSKILIVLFPIPALFIGFLMGAFGHRHTWKVVRLALIVTVIEVVLGFVFAIAAGSSEASQPEGLKRGPTIRKHLAEVVVLHTLHDNRRWRTREWGFINCDHGRVNRVNWRCRIGWRNGLRQVWCGYALVTGERFGERQPWYRTTWNARLC